MVVVGGVGGVGDSVGSGLRRVGESQVSDGFEKKRLVGMVEVFGIGRDLGVLDEQQQSTTTWRAQRASFKTIR